MIAIVATTRCISLLVYYIFSFFLAVLVFGVCAQQRLSNKWLIIQVELSTIIIYRIGAVITTLVVNLNIFFSRLLIALRVLCAHGAVN